MLFSSITFLFYFLPAVLLFYYAVPFRFKNGVLVLFSLLFYAWGEPANLVYMLLCIAVCYAGGRALERYTGTRYSRWILLASMAIPVGLLLRCKYGSFLIENVNALTGLSFAMPRILLPAGISFYTFQILSYLIDVYKGRQPAQTKPLNLAVYICLFPQLIAGPIVRYSEIEPQLASRTVTGEGLTKGIVRFLIGLAKKVLLANGIGAFVAAAQAAEPSVVLSWVSLIAYALQVYFDFSGYSDMAIGLGYLFGFTFPENFRYPFTADSITEFWRRWHITLGSWFRDYVYIPLGGGRVPHAKKIRNILIVWGLTGLWHGAAWNFVLWGLYYGILLILEKEIVFRYFTGIPVFLKKAGTQLLVLWGFILFRAENLAAACSDFASLFGNGGVLWNAEGEYLLRRYAVLLLICLIGCTPIPLRAAQALKQKLSGTLAESLTLLLLLVCLLLSTAFLVDGSYNPFLYFRF